MIKLLVKKESQPYGSVYFKYAEELTEEEAMNIQQDSGFHPCGYGFYSHKIEGGVTTWNCSNFCD
tara:strand:+ start:812 stop:1006 length:195 start_codon:yes stop_codon:yes gene_type:complete